MSNILGWFNGTVQASEEIPEIFPFPLLESEFVKTDVTTIYKKILTDVLERTQGIPENQANLLWDNCVASESSDGLVTLLSNAMCAKSDLFIVYDKALNLVRLANQEEKTQIAKDYKDQAQSKVGIFITFKNYKQTDMVKIYSSLEYCTIASLSKNMNLSKAIQLKLTDIRSSTALIDSKDVKAQAVEIAKGLAAGKDIAIDAKDVIETAKPDLTATQAAIDFIAQKRSFYLGLPASYITGLQSKGLSDTGQGDAKAIERGLKNYYFSIVKPALDAIFGIKTSFESEDFNQLSSSLEALKTFEITSDELISQDNKRIMINKMFGLPEDTLGDAPEKIEVAPPGVTNEKKV